MDYLYFDTNALIKLYRIEKGSNWLRNFIIGKGIVVSELVLFESATVVGRYYRSGAYTLKEAVDLYDTIQRDVTGYNVIPLQNARLRAEIEAVSFPPNLVKGSAFVRALDAIHVASAQNIRKRLTLQDPGANLVVVSSDGQLLKVAQVNGLVVENPEDYP